MHTHARAHCCVLLPPCDVVWSLCAAGAGGAALVSSEGPGRAGGGEEKAGVAHRRDPGGESEGAPRHTLWSVTACLKGKGTSIVSSLPPSSLQGESDSTTDLDTSLKGESHHDLEHLLGSLAGVHAIMCPANGQGNTRRK